MTQGPAVCNLDPKDPDLLGTICREYLDSEITGEKKTKALLFLVCCSAFTDHSLSAILKGHTAGGKSKVANKVLDIFRPLGIVLEYGRITPTFLENLAYRERQPKPKQEKDESDEGYLERVRQWKRQPLRVNLAGKILFIGELKGIQSSQAPKLLISEGGLRLGTVINNEPVELEVVGTPVIITTTTLAALEDPELENRILPLQIDESEEQTGEVLEYHARRYEDPAEDLTEYRRREALKEFFGEFKPYKVANPYARKLAEHYPKKNIEARRDFPKLLNLCNVVTWLHQYQRAKAKKGLDVVLVADPVDIQLAWITASAALQESLMGISSKEQPILDYLKGLAEKVTESVKEPGQQELTKVETTLYEPRTLREIYQATRKVVRRGEEWCRKHVKRLVEDGYVEEEEVKANRFQYRYAAIQPQTLEVNNGFPEGLLQEWASGKGYTLLSGWEEETRQIPTESDPSLLKQAKNSPNSQFGKYLGVNGAVEPQTMGNSHSSKSSPSVGQLGPPFLEVGRCADCGKNQPLRPDHRAQFKVCEACFEKNSVKGAPV